MIMPRVFRANVGDLIAAFGKFTHLLDGKIGLFLQRQRCGLGDNEMCGNAV
jgi:hypothetical protein